QHVGRLARLDVIAAELLLLDVAGVGGRRGVGVHDATVLVEVAEHLLLRCTRRRDDERAYESDNDSLHAGNLLFDSDCTPIPGVRGTPTVGQPLSPVRPRARDAP